jgi:hypothetical protein
MLESLSPRVRDGTGLVSSRLTMSGAGREFDCGCGWRDATSGGRIWPTSAFGCAEAGRGLDPKREGFLFCSVVQAEGYRCARVDDVVGCVEATIGARRLDIPLAAVTRTIDVKRSAPGVLGWAIPACFERLAMLRSPRLCTLNQPSCGAPRFNIFVRGVGPAWPN